MKGKLIFVLLVLPVLLLSGCYINDDVATDQVGVRLNGGKIVDVVGPGVYTSWGLFADLVEVSRATLTFSVSDPEVATSDNQLVGVAITIQAQRQASRQSIENLMTNWSHLRNDENLISVVSATAKEGIKNGTRGFTLTRLLDDRNGLADAIVNQIEQDANKYGVDVINVTIENIDLDDRYAATLQEKAQYTAEIDKEKRRQDLVAQTAETDRLEQEKRTAVLMAQLEKEKAQTAIDVEIARREGQKTAAANEVYKLNDQAYELQRIRELAKVIGTKATVWFIPQGTDLSLILNNQSQQVLPLAEEE